MIVAGIQSTGVTSHKSQAKQTDKLGSHFIIRAKLFAYVWPSFLKLEVSEVMTSCLLEARLKLLKKTPVWLSRHHDDPRHLDTREAIVLQLNT